MTYIKGLGTLLMMAGGGASEKLTDEEDAKVQDAVFKAGVAGTLPVVGRGVAAKVTEFGARKMRNMSPDAYSMGNITPDTRSEKIAFKAIDTLGKGTSEMKRNMPKSIFRNFSVLRKDQYGDLERTIAEQGLKNTSAELEWDKYVNQDKKMNRFNATPEELRWKIVSENNVELNNKLQTQIDDIDYALERGKLSPEGRRQLVKKRRELIPQYEKAGANGRLYRHEIAKNEIQAMSFGRKYSKERLIEAGYKPKGMYRWKDLKEWLPEKSWKDWQGGGRFKTGMHNNMLIPVVNNIHRGDRLVQGKFVSRGLDYGRAASKAIAQGRAKNPQELYAHIIKRMNADEAFHLTWRELKDAGDNSALAKQKLARRLVMDAKKSNAWSKGGAMQVNVGKNLGITNLYLEGGINTTAEFKPIYKDGALKYIDDRMVKTDFQDLGPSVKLGLQKHPVLVVDSVKHRYNIQSGSVTSGGKEDLAKDLSMKRSMEGDIIDYRGKYGTKKAIGYAAKKAKKAPMKAAKIALRHLPGGLKIAAPLAAMSYPIFAGDDE